MYGKLVKIVIKPGKRDQVIEFLWGDAALARAAEPGTIRFDVWDVPDQPDALYLYEAYTDPEAFAIHRANEPYQRFVNKIDPELLDEQCVVFDWTNSLIPDSDSNPETNSDDITRLSFGSFPPATDSAAHFNGYAELRRLAPSGNASVSHVHFPPGVRTDWHHHDGQQLLWFIEGEGRVAIRNGKTLSCRAGDLIRVDAGLSHWHGASAEHYATHIAITVGGTKWEGRP
ncbi:MAG TPA: antibiotic biosynthesis monooxygenase [Nitrolancea sp.]|nr:antibiotic biosynthesis monooxygenase [Nitrolancea sp.]